MNRETTFLLGTIILGVVIIILLYKYKKETLLSVAYYVTIQAEEHFLSGQGKEKLKYSISEFKKRIPEYLSWLISEENIIKLIEKALKELQLSFKGAEKRKLDEINSILNSMSTDSKSNIKHDKNNSMDGNIEGYIEGRSNLNGDSSIAAGVKIIL